jgi:hypothetical protein
MTRYTVTVARTIEQWIDVDVEENTEDAAKETAVALAEQAESFEWENNEDSGDDYQAIDCQRVDLISGKA